MADAEGHTPGIRLGIGSDIATRRACTLSIAVLPFADMSPAHDQEWLCDGIAEEILNALAQVPGIRVTARTSAFAFKGKNEDIRHIAAALGVQHVLEGSVRRAGDRIRVTAQLVAAHDGQLAVLPSIRPRDRGCVCGAGRNRRCDC